MLGFKLIHVSHVTKRGAISGDYQTEFLSLLMFSVFSQLLKCYLLVEYYIYIWIVLPQLSRDDTCLIWEWCDENISAKAQMFLMVELTK